MTHLRQRKRLGRVMVECTLSITHCLRLNLQLHTIDLVRTCRISSFCTVVWQLARFQLTRSIARSLGDSGASCFVWHKSWGCLYGPPDTVTATDAYQWTFTHTHNTTHATTVMHTLMCFYGRNEKQTLKFRKKLLPHFTQAIWLHCCSSKLFAGTRLTGLTIMAFQTRSSAIAAWPRDASCQ